MSWKKTGLDCESRQFLELVSLSRRNVVNLLAHHKDYEINYLATGLGPPTFISSLYFNH